jgi:hypothetical protein
MRWSAALPASPSDYWVGKSQTEHHIMQIKSIGIDLGKTTFTPLLWEAVTGAV